MTSTANIKRDIRSSRLVAKQSFISGMGSIFNLYGTYFDFNYSKSDVIADKKALKKDWEMVGNNIKYAIKSVKVK